jgi:hypothetical protein
MAQPSAPIDSAMEKIAAATAARMMRVWRIYVLFMTSLSITN